MISRDVTESVEAAQALNDAKEEAERANLARSEFMSRMSHELRTPLNSVLGFAQILQMEMSSAEELELIGYIVKSGGYLLELINEVLDIEPGDKDVVQAGQFGFRPRVAHGGDDVPTVAGKEPGGCLADPGGGAGD